MTRQIAVGIGYGINYTPNHGKVVLHASANMMLVCYSVNHISYYLPDSLRADLPSGEPMYTLQPVIPVHVTGNVRAGVSWAWKAQLTFGVRLGAGKDRIERALGKTEIPKDDMVLPQKAKLPRWLTDYFWSPK